MGINLLPHAVSVLDRLGLASVLEELGIATGELVNYNRHGQRISGEPRGLRGGNARGFWSSIWLRVSAPQWAHLNQQQFIVMGRKLDHCIAIEVFELPAL